LADNDTPNGEAPAPDVQPAPRRPWWRLFLLRGLALVVAIVAGVLVSVFTVDLGPSLRRRAEDAGSKYLERPMHIGRLSAKLRPGVFEVDDVVIEGLEPGDRPFLTAKTITVSLPWWTIFTHKLAIEWIEMSDWDMVIETFPNSDKYPNGRHNFPKFVHERKEPRQPGRWPFTTTLRYLIADRGSFTYLDHGTPWSTVGRNLRVQVWRDFLNNNYGGEASFSDGTIHIQSYESFRASMQSRFAIAGPQLHFSRIDLQTEGATSTMDGDIDLGHWPEQTYRITSKIDFQTQKSIFFHTYNFNATGLGDFTGTFHLFKGGRELKGSFSTPMARVKIGAQNWSFPDLRGNVLWVPEKLEVIDATSGLYGGTARFDYRLAPLNRKNVPARASWDVRYRDVDLAQLTDFIETQGIRLAGRISGQNRLDWALGRWGEKTGSGETTASAPPGTAMMTREFQPAAVAHEIELPPEAGPFNPHHPLGYVPVAGHITYALDPNWITVGKSWTATEKTYVEYDGRTAYGVRSRLPFHVTSLDWQESDRVLAGIMTAFGAPTGAVPIGGMGQFDGVMLEAFSKPRIEGTFTGERMRAWDVEWGTGHADVVIENSYVAVKDTTITRGRGEIHADGLFSLGYPRRDRGEEINARVEIARWPLAELRHAFELDDWPVEGVVSGKYHLYGNYETPYGFGNLVIDEGVAYGETFDPASAALRFEGSGVRLDGLNIKKSTGAMTGAAWVGWDGNYSFNADGAKIPVESLKTVAFPKAPLSGIVQFKASGTGTFEVPRYDVSVRVDDLFAGEEEIGQLTGALNLRGELLTTRFDVASKRLAVSGTGRIAMTDEMDAELSLRFQDTSLDPYFRFFEPRLSPFTTAVAAGTVRVVGELADVDHLVVEAKVEELDMKLFDYRVSNRDPRANAYVPIELGLDQGVATIDQFRLFGDGTALSLSGTVGLNDSTIAVKADGDANLGILPGFFREVRSSGSAALEAEVNGSLEKPVFSGSASIANGRIRHMLMPHSLEAINGRLAFDAQGIRIEGLAAKLGGGDVQFGGRIGIEGFAPGELALTATGTHMQLRYPEGFTSVVDADLALHGRIDAPVLGGTVTVHDALYARTFDPNSLMSLSGGGSPSGRAAGPAPASTIPLRLDITINAPRSLRVQNSLMRVVASANLSLQGTYDHPQLFGTAQVDRGDFIFEGNRYVITRGTIGFNNPTRIEPYIDVEAETRVRTPGETYRVTINLTGANQYSLTFDSDPPLSQVAIVSLLLGQTVNLQNAELRALDPAAAARAEQELLTAATARLLSSTATAPVSRAVESALGVDFQISPTFGSASEGDPLTASARILLGRRISNRAYLTFTRDLGGTASDQIVVLEYEQNDRLGWVLTQTGSQTFSIEFRVRHVF
jgi:hypothetical protein